MLLQIDEHGGSFAFLVDEELNAFHFNLRWLGCIKTVLLTATVYRICEPASFGAASKHDPPAAFPTPPLAAGSKWKAVPAFSAAAARRFSAPFP